MDSADSSSIRDSIPTAFDHHDVEHTPWPYLVIYFLIEIALFVEMGNLRHIAVEATSLIEGSIKRRKYLPALDLECIWRRLEFAINTRSRKDNEIVFT